MSIKLELSPDLEKAYLAAAEARGVALDVVLHEVLVAGQPLENNYQRLPTDEWVKKLDEWIASHADLDLPPLSQVDMSRETIYADRGLVDGRI